MCRLALAWLEARLHWPQKWQPVACITPLCTEMRIARSRICILHYRLNCSYISTSHSHRNETMGTQRYIQKDKLQTEWVHEDGVCILYQRKSSLFPKWRCIFRIFCGSRGNWPFWQQNASICHSSLLDAPSDVALAFLLYSKSMRHVTQLTLLYRQFYNLIIYIFKVYIIFGIYICIYVYHLHLQTTYACMSHHVSSARGLKK